MFCILDQISTSVLHYSDSSNRVTGIYELSLCKMADTGSPGRLLSSDLFGGSQWSNFLAINGNYTLLVISINVHTLCVPVCAQACRGEDGKFWTHQWHMCVERRTWLGGGPEETVWSLSTSGSLKNLNSYMRWGASYIISSNNQHQNKHQNNPFFLDRRSWNTAGSYGHLTSCFTVAEKRMLWDWAKNIVHIAFNPHFKSENKQWPTTWAQIGPRY